MNGPSGEEAIARYTERIGSLEPLSGLRVQRS